MDRMLEATARAEDDHFWFRSLRRNAAWLLDQASSGRPLQAVVDAGAGTGRNLEWLRRHGRAIGVELHESGLAVGRRLGRPLARATVTALPVADASVDLVTSFDVLYCLEDADEHAAIAEMFRVLRPGGLVLVNAAALDILHGSHSTLTHEVRRYTRRRLAERLTRAGFHIERMTFTNMLTFPPTLAVRLLDRMTGRADQASDAELTVPPRIINALVDVLLKIEHRLIRRLDLPFGTSLLCVARKPDRDAGLG
jgi:SAM-dependent methyltransferase